jgi:hypothetical protein
VRKAIILYGVLNAAAYSMLMPLWEGFDEAYHYGYVQILSTQHTFPSLGHAWLSREIWHVLELAPVSHYLQPFTRAPMNFEEYFKLSDAERVERRTRLESLPASKKFEAQSDKPNYEVNQSPLPYVWMAAIDAALASRPLPARILMLRLICSILAVLLLAHAGGLLSGVVGLSSAATSAMLFCVFSSQMLYATLCHVCNDWLAVPLFTYFVRAAIRVATEHSRRDCLMLGVVLMAALLTKAYFLVCIPIALAVIAHERWRRRIDLTGVALFGLALLPAVPWYVRNLVLYHNLSATVETTSGIGLRQLVDAAVKLPWGQSIVYMAHSSLWTGNNSFTTFSAMTLDVILALLGVALAFNFVRQKIDAPRMILASSIALFSAGLAYVTITFYASSKGGATAAVPWYMQALLAPVLVLAFAGLDRAEKWGTWFGRLTIVVWLYVLAATYVVKLVPMYGGFGDHRAHVRDLWRWYVHDAAQRNQILATISLAPPGVIYLLLMLAIATGITCCCILLARSGTAPEPRPPQTATR